MSKQQENYEKPTISFEHLNLSEKIADTCFGYGNTATYSGVSPAIVIETGGCGGSATAEKINNALSAANIARKVNPSVCNTKDADFKSNFS
ncbi:hypothetical protein LJC58_03865 [Lachnospiraceae bacterium OttesenSCG-928-D06]|nr:hypothetical protein [Lachnospiraceae bacterium OttesenSCG-928-D06]